MNYNKIVNHLYFGNLVPRSDFFHLIVNCTHEFPFSYFCKERVRIPVNEDEPDECKIIELLIQTNVLKKIHTCISNKENVLVHCFGVEKQRSFVIIICYLMLYYDLTPDEAIEHVHEKSFIGFLDNIRFFSTIQIFYEYIIKNRNKNRNKNIKN